MTPGQRLRQLRRMKGLKQVELVAALFDKYQVRIDNSSISSYEKDINTPPPQIYELLADFFDVSLDYLRCLTDETRPKPPVVLNPDILEFAQRLNDLPNGLARAVIEVSDKMIVEMVKINSDLDARLGGLRARMAAQRGEGGVLEWEQQRGIRLPYSSSESS